MKFQKEAVWSLPISATKRDRSHSLFSSTNWTLTLRQTESFAYVKVEFILEITAMLF